MRSRTVLYALAATGMLTAGAPSAQACHLFGWLRHHGCCSPDGQRVVACQTFQRSGWCSRVSVVCWETTTGQTTTVGDTAKGRETGLPLNGSGITFAVSGLDVAERSVGFFRNQLLDVAGWTAYIEWGDGTRDFGKIQEEGTLSGLFVVYGKHVYQSAAPYAWKPIHVTVYDSSNRLVAAMDSAVALKHSPAGSGGSGTTPPAGSGGSGTAPPTAGTSVRFLADSRSSHTRQTLTKDSPIRSALDELAADSVPGQDPRSLPAQPNRGPQVVGDDLAVIRRILDVPSTPPCVRSDHKPGTRMRDEELAEIERMLDEPPPRHATQPMTLPGLIDPRSTTILTASSRPRSD
jgi:hypothetical protein